MTKRRTYKFHLAVADLKLWSSTPLWSIFSSFSCSSRDRWLTRMHSSRMRTVCSGSHLTGGCLVPGGVCSRGVPGPGEVPRPGGGLVQGSGIPACTEVDPPVNRMTDRCKNITFATSLRTVKRCLRTV